MTSIKKGDFSALAEDYAKYRPSYNHMVVDMIIGATGKIRKEIAAADVGAGTGIFTKLLSERGLKSLTAVEPNDNMRQQGQIFLPNGVKWVGGPAEATTLEENSLDLVSMASSFHWPDTQKALAEFNRILRKGGVFVAIWNPRITERSKIEAEIDKLLNSKYSLQSRVSSGRSGITTRMAEILNESKYFSDVSYIEAMNVVDIPPARYVGAWRSVNDIRSQLGEQQFQNFIVDVEKMTNGLRSIDVHYLTRAWVARK